MSFLVDMYDSARTPLAALWLLVGALTIVSAVLAVARLLPVSRKTLADVAKPDTSPRTQGMLPVEEGERERACSLSLPPLFWLRAHPKISFADGGRSPGRASPRAGSAPGPTGRRPEVPPSSRAQRIIRARLVLTCPPRLSGTFYPLTGTHMVVGRGAAAEVSIDDGYVSRAHALLTKTRESYVIEDLGSAGGTTVNGDRLSGPRHLQHGDTLHLGPNVETRFELQLDEVDQTIVLATDNNEGCRSELRTSMRSKS